MTEGQRLQREASETEWDRGEFRAVSSLAGDDRWRDARVKQALKWVREK